MKKIYRGERDHAGRVIVFVVPAGGDSYRLPARHELCNHSPTGFEIGYSGSGPAQLAFAILADSFGGEIAWQLHQEFKQRFIATLDRRSPFKIYEKDVAEFVLGKMRSRAKQTEEEHKDYG